MRPTSLTITEAGVYRLSGSLEGQVRVEAPDEALVVLLLDGVTIANSEGAAIEVVSADDVAIHLAAGSKNTVSDATSYADDAEANAAIWADTDLTISGEGSLEVSANGNDGLQAFTDTIIAADSTVTVDAADDGIKGEVTVSFGLRNTEDTSNGPTVTIVNSSEGIEAANIGINAGKIDINAADDGINASGNAELQALIEGIEYVAGNREADTGERLEITGGDISVVAGFDGLDSNGTITITGGSVNITAAERGGDGPIDANGEINVTEGIVVANGSAWDPSSAMMPGGPGGTGGPGAMPGDGEFEMPPGGTPPEGMPTPPEGMPMPPEGMPEGNSTSAG